ncbi:MAG: phosphonate C-P lyase system protein PhnH [Rhodospirillales bacterium]
MTAATLPQGPAPAAGFGDPVHDSQAVFRAVLRAMSRPGEVQELTVPIVPPAPLISAAAAVCLALLDLETRLWVDGGSRDVSQARDFLAFHTGAPTASAAADADFVVIADGAMVPRLDIFRQGSDEAPEKSATLIVQVADLDDVLADGAWRLSGPGIDGTAGLRIEGLRGGLAEELADNRGRFPRGVDLILCTKTRVAGLPRTTKVEA